MTGVSMTSGAPWKHALRFAIQCALKDFVEAGDHYLYICDVSAVCRSQEFHLDEQRRSAVHRNFTWASNGNPPVAGIPLGRATAIRRSLPKRKFLPL